MANVLETKEMDALKQLFTQVLRQTATVLSTILRLKSQISLQDVLVLSKDEIASRYPQRQLITRFNISNDMQGQGLLLLSEDLSSVLCDISMGGQGKNPPAQLGQNELNVLSQLVNQLITALSAALSQTLSKKVNLANPELKLSTLDPEGISGITAGLGAAIVIGSRLSLEGIAEGQFAQVIPVSIGKEFVAIAGTKATRAEQRIEPLSFSPLDKGGVTPSGDLGSLLVDIPLQLSVELGRTRMPLKDVLELGVGSIIELERLSGEPVDIMLNNKPLAKGEVVVIDENIGVRLTHIVNPNERI